MEILAGLLGLVVVLLFWGGALWGGTKIVKRARRGKPDKKKRPMKDLVE